MITVLSGGTGTPKLLQGIKKIVPEEELNIIVNTIENNYFSGVYVAADIDTVLYTMSDKINEETWYGRKDDTFTTHQTLKKLGYNELLRIGDKDRALKIQKTMLLQKYSLTQAVKIQKEQLNIKAEILPMTDDTTEIMIQTPQKNMTFHEYLITHQAKPEVTKIEYTQTQPTQQVIETLEQSDQIIIGPSNPITSIEPIINMPGIKKILKKIHTTSISPIIGTQAYTGPAAKFMKARNMEISPRGVARIYQEFLDHYIINTTDYKYKSSIKEFIPEVSVENIIFKTMEEKIQLAQKILKI